MNVIDFIRKNIKKTVRINTGRDDTLIGLPYPYTVPTVSEAFQEMYYWDTYFTNVGLLVSGESELARYNTDNLLYMADKYGFVPKGNRTWFLNRSQPPFLSLMVKDIYNETKDCEWLENAVKILEKEYSFWMTERITDTGLNCYGSNASDDACYEDCDSFARRLHIDVSDADRNQKIFRGKCFYAECESGWDFSPRFSLECKKYLPIDLNCLLYLYEINFVYFYRQLGKNPSKYAELAKKRNELINKYLFDTARGVYADYNYVDKTFSDVLSCASFFPYFANIEPHDGNDVETLYNALMKDYGLIACENNSNIAFQWASPNGWAPLQFVAYIGLKNVGKYDLAEEVKRKYIALIEKNFATHRNLFEKYNVINGNCQTVDEYQMPTMLGWTAGVFLYFRKDYFYETYRRNKS